MAKRKSFLLRLDPRMYEELRIWADDEMRSVNAQIEYLLHRSLKEAGRRKTTKRIPKETSSRESSKRRHDPG